MRMCVWAGGRGVVEGCTLVISRELACEAAWLSHKSLSSRYRGFGGRPPTFLAGVGEVHKLQAKADCRERNVDPACWGGRLG